MMRLLAVVALTLTIIPGLCAPPKVAVVYSSWPDNTNSFKGEFDDEMAQLGWAREEFENRDIARLVERLGEFDLVIAAGVANYDNTQDMAPHAEKWLEFLRAGGCLLITDASYDSVLGEWVNTFGEDFRLSSATCASHREGTPESREIVVSGHPLMTSPHLLEPILRQRGIWAHIDSWTDAWTSLVTCKDDKSLFVSRHVGKGLVVVTSYFSFKGANGLTAGTAILENLLLYLSHSKAGVAITELKLGEPRPGKHTASLTLKNLTGEAMGLTAQFSTQGSEGEATEGPDTMVSLAPTATETVALPHEITVRGSVALNLSLTGAGGEKLVEWPMRMRVPAAVSVSLRRKHLYPRADDGKGTPLQGRVTVCPSQEQTGKPVSLSLLVDGAPVGVAQTEGLAAQVSVPTDGLPAGRHELIVRATAQGDLVGETAEEFFIHPPARVALREDGVILLEGKPFFPFGFYHVSQSFPEEHRLKMVQDMAAAGFNCAHTRSMTIDTYRPFLDECARLGVYIVTEFSSPMEETVTTFREHPAVLAWNPGDEPCINGVLPEEMFDRYDRFKQIAPDHLVYTVICSPGEYLNYSRGTDILAPDPYPVPNAPIGTVYSLLKSARTEALKYDTTLLGVLQCFGGYGPWTRPPSAQELRSMTYLSLLAGVKGIIYYTYGDGGWVVTDHPEQWEASKALVAEITALRRLVFAGLPQMLTEGEDGVYAGAWELDGATYMLVVNGADDACEVNLPAQAATVRDMFGNGADWRIENGRLRGSLPGLTAAALELRP